MAPHIPLETSPSKLCQVDLSNFHSLSTSWYWLLAVRGCSSITICVISWIATNQNSDLKQLRLQFSTKCYFISNSTIWNLTTWTWNSSWTLWLCWGLKTNSSCQSKYDSIKLPFCKLTVTVFLSVEQIKLAWYPKKSYFCFTLDQQFFLSPNIQLLNIFKIKLCPCLTLILIWLNCYLSLKIQLPQKTICSVQVHSSVSLLNNQSIQKSANFWTWSLDPIEEGGVISKYLEITKSINLIWKICMYFKYVEI